MATTVTKTTRQTGAKVTKCTIRRVVVGAKVTTTRTCKTTAPKPKKKEKKK